MYKYNCDFKKNHTLSDKHNITIEDEYLFHKVLHFCNWNCLLGFIQINRFAIKKEQLFHWDNVKEVDIRSLNY